MSNSKFIMAKKLQRVQVALMEEKISSTQLQVLLPLIFKKCLKENMTFWFNFLEDACDMENYKLQVLLNAFLITPGENPIENASSATMDETHQEETVDKPIQESNLVPPSAVRAAIELCEKNNEPVTRKNVENKLNLGQMSQDKRRQCIAYLRSMEDKL